MSDFDEEDIASASAIAASDIRTQHHFTTDAPGMFELEQLEREEH